MFGSRSWKRSDHEMVTTGVIEFALCNVNVILVDVMRALAYTRNGLGSRKRAKLQPA